MRSNRKIKDSYYIEQDHYIMEIFFEYYSEEATNYEELEIQKVILNQDTDITDLYFDMIESESLEEEIINSLDI